MNASKRLNVSKTVQTYQDHLCALVKMVLLLMKMEALAYVRIVVCRKVVWLVRPSLVLLFYNVAEIEE